jgi:hypothetical protein
MAGVKTTKGGSLTATMNKFTANISGRLEGRSKATAIRAGIAAQQAMQNVIATTPSGINPSKPDRIDTGNMYNRVTHSTSFRHQRYTAKFGWLYNHKQYFITQDQGGLAFGKFQVVGMFALAAGVRAARRVMEEDLGKAVKK